MFLLVPAYPGSPGEKAVKRLCACVRACVRSCMRACVRSCVVQVIKSLQDPLEAGNNLTGISDSVRE